MTQYRSYFSSAIAEFFVPFPQEIAEMIDNEEQRNGGATSIRPNLPVTYFDECRAVQDFEEGLDFEAIRAEMSRQAKKLDLSHDGSIHFQHERRGLRIWAHLNKARK